MSDRKIFDDFSEVDCNECEHWWLNRCDGASKGSTVGCTSYSATRSIVIPERLNVLQRRVQWLTLVVASLIGWHIGQLIGEWFFG